MLSVQAWILLPSLKKILVVHIPTNIQTKIFKLEHYAKSVGRMGMEKT